MSLGRLGEPARENSEFKGTVFDARIRLDNVRRFRTFQEASLAINMPQTFVGVSNQVTDLLTQCRWGELLSFRMAIDGVTTHKESRSILPTGILIKNLPNNAEWNALAENEFIQLKKVLSRQVR